METRPPSESVLLAVVKQRLRVYAYPAWCCTRVSKLDICLSQSPLHTISKCVITKPTEHLRELAGIAPIRFVETLLIPVCFKRQAQKCLVFLQPINAHPSHIPETCFRHLLYYYRVFPIIRPTSKIRPSVIFEDDFNVSPTLKISPS